MNADRRTHPERFTALAVSSIFALLASCGQQLVQFPDSSVPSIISTDPDSGATGVPASRPVRAIFSQAMDPSTIGAATFTLAQGGVAVPGQVTYSGVIATFTPAATLSADTLYTATIGVGAKSAANETELAAAVTWTFTTAAAIVPPLVIVSTDPGNGSTGIPVDQQVRAVFSAAMDPATLTSATFSLEQGTAQVAGTVSASGTGATFAPAAPLADGTVYTATITTGAKDAAGTALAANYVWSFTTGPAAPDAPAVTVVDPASGAVDVALGAKIQVAFNEVMDCATLTSATFAVAQGETAIAGAVTCADSAATFTPSAPLAAGSSYTATVLGGSAGAKDPAGHALAASYSWSFTTLDSTLPLITSVEPEDGATGVCPNAVIEAVFGSAMNGATLTSSTFTLAGPANSIQGVVQYDSMTHTASFTPANNLQTDTKYVATVGASAMDQEGNSLGQAKVWRFTTGSTPCQQPVNLNSLSTFVAVAGAGLTNSNSGGETVLGGDVGLSPAATCLGDGSPCSALDPVINGTLYADDPAGVAAAAKVDLTTAYDDAMGRPPGATVNDLSGMTLAPGVYSSGSTMGIAVGQTLVLDAQGDANGVWIFQVGSSLTVNNNAQVLLVNGAKAGNVFWAIFASSTLGDGVTFKGNVLAGSSNSVGTGSQVEGRLLCRTGQITLLADTITLPSP